MTMTEQEPRLIGCCDIGYIAGHSAAGYPYDKDLTSRIPKTLPEILAAVSNLTAEMDRAIALKLSEEPDALENSYVSTQIAEAFYMLMHSEKMLNFHGINTK